MWNYSSEDAYPIISLHDCRITKVFVDHQDIIFEFDENGFWVAADHKLNPFGKTLRTGRSEIRFVNCNLDFSNIYLFKAFRMFGKQLLTKRTEITIENFASQISNGTWQFEFVDELYAWHQALFNGCLWFDKRPYHLECQIQLSFEKMLYSWNTIYEDRAW